MSGDGRAPPRGLRRALWRAGYYVALPRRRWREIDLLLDHGTWNPPRRTLATAGTADRVLIHLAYMFAVGSVVGALGFILLKVIQIDKLTPWHDLSTVLALGFILFTPAAILSAVVVRIRGFRTHARAVLWLPVSWLFIVMPNFVAPIALLAFLRGLAYELPMALPSTVAAAAASEVTTT